MELLTLAIIIILVLVVLMIIRHLMFKTFTKSIISTLIVIFIFLLIIAVLTNENEIQTKSPIIQTGATVVENIKETNFMESITDKIEDFIDEIKE